MPSKFPHQNSTKLPSMVKYPKSRPLLHDVQARLAGTSHLAKMLIAILTPVYFFASL